MLIQEDVLLWPNHMSLGFKRVNSWILLCEMVPTHLSKVLSLETAKLSLIMLDRLTARIKIHLNPDVYCILRHLAEEFKHLWIPSAVQQLFSIR